MKKTYKIEVDCPTCAQKLETCANSIDGVEKAAVNLMTQKLAINAEKEDQDRIIHEIADKMKKIDDEVVIYF
ncbi:cation transporter [Erysipelotrichaceae bacterium RD49]|nr:cation transporter [Erysipelotrichaceae bacterium RD49]